MAKKITWEDKEHILPYGTRENQVWDLDMNEIKTVVNANADSLAGLEGGYQGVLLIADTPTNDGYYLAGESGTYTNAGGLVVDLTDTITFINKVGVVYTKTEIPLTVPTLNAGTLNPASTTLAETGKTIADYIATLRGGTVTSGETKDVSGNTAYLKIKKEAENNLQLSVLNENEIFEYLGNSNRYDVENLNASITRTQTLITPDSDFKLPFKTIFRNQYVVPAVNSSYFYYTKIKPRYSEFAVSMWFSNAYEDGVEKSATQVAFRFQWIKGINNTLVKYIYKSINTVTIASSVAANGYYEYEDTDYILRCNGKVVWNGKNYWNFQIYVKYIHPSEVDHIKIGFGNDSVFVQNKTTIIDYTGFEILDFNPNYTTSTINEYYNGETPQIDFKSQVIRKFNTDNEYRGTYLLENKCKDLFDQCMQFKDAYGVSRTQYTYGILNVLSGLTLTKSDNDKFGYSYTVDNNGSALPIWVSSTTKNKLIEILSNGTTVYDEELLGTSFGFWVNRTELNGADLMFTMPSGGELYVSYKELLVEGLVETRWQSGTYAKDIEVKLVDGDYTYIQINDFTKYNICLKTNPNSITSFTIYNPTIITSSNIDPYYNYRSQSEKNNSSVRGKWLMNFGDSQQNDLAIVRNLAKELGLNVVTSSLGGHRMKYSSTSWMYNKIYRKQVMAIDYVDFYLFMVSSNDSAGGGNVGQSYVDAVLANYYVDGDDAATEASKDALFNALTSGEKDAIFGYKQTYSAYLKQLQTKYPEAKFCLTSIPISQYATTEYDVDGITTIYKSTTNADAQRIIGDAIFPSLRDDVIQLTEKHNTHFCDLFKESGITYENFPSKVEGTDSVHWKSEVKRCFAYTLKRFIEAMNNG
jgi:hypothetical protein